MSLKKTVAILAAAGALAAISVPAMALENEFHGFYQIKGFVSNYNDGAAADLSPAALRHNERANNYAEQRARTQLAGEESGGQPVGDAPVDRHGELGRLRRSREGVHQLDGRRSAKSI